MKKYNIQNYLRYKKDLEGNIERIVKDFKSEDVDKQSLTRNDLIIYYMPIVESIARKFSTSDQASGVLSINDLIQEGNLGLVYAVDRIEWDTINASNDPDLTLYSFLSKRIKGSIRRAIDTNRGDMRIPEYKLNEIRKDNGKDKKMVEMFFNSVFLSIDHNREDDTKIEIQDHSKEYNIDLLNKYLLSLMRTYLDDKEYDILRMSFGLDCDKVPAKEIARMLDIKGTADFVRVSQIKREALDKLIENVDPDQVLDFL
jgi:RNA polymerase sigma factor (sigma-70 family)